MNCPARRGITLSRHRAAGCGRRSGSRRCPETGRKLRQRLSTIGNPITLYSGVCPGHRVICGNARQGASIASRTGGGNGGLLVRVQPGERRGGLTCGYSFRESGRFVVLPAWLPTLPGPRSESVRTVGALAYVEAMETFEVASGQERTVWLHLHQRGYRATTGDMLSGAHVSVEILLMPTCCRSSGRSTPRRGSARTGASGWRRCLATCPRRDRVGITTSMWLRAGRMGHEGTNPGRDNLVRYG